METGLIHIISEIGGCIIGDPPDNKGITNSLQTYANRQDMADLKVLDPPTDNLGEWAGMAAFAIEEYGIEGPGACRNPPGRSRSLWVSRSATAFLRPRRL